MALPEIGPVPGFGSPQQSGEIELLPAKINDRFIAYIIDVFPFCAAYVGYLYMVVMKWHTSTYTKALDHQVGLAAIGAYLLYQFIGNATGATVGKRLMGIRIVRKDGQPLGILGAVLRTVGYVISTPLCNWGFIVALFHPESRAVHDIFSGSVVIEPNRRNQAESILLFVCAIVLLVFMYAAMFFLNMNRVTEKDLMAIDKAKDGLKIMAQVEEAYKASHATYTESLDGLAQASGDADKFRAAMSGIFDPNQFAVEAGNRGYRISGKALDRRKTRVTIEGPPPTLKD
jgi:uncharacterized RDD family membrane protein YckC